MVSLRLRISIALLMAIGIGLVFTVRSIMYDLRPHYLSAMEEVLVDSAELLAATVLITADGQLDCDALEASMNRAADRTLDAHIYEKHKQRVDVECYVCDKNGIVVYSSRDPLEVGMDYSQWNDVYLCLQGKYGARASAIDAEDPHTAILYVAAPIMHNGEIYGSLSVAKHSDSVLVFVNSGRGQIINITIISVLVLGFIIILVSLWVTRPIHALERYARETAEGKRSQLPALSAPELKRMADALAYMRSMLDGKQYVETYVQQLTHEFKSPLSVISGASELLQEPMSAEQQQVFLTNIEREVQRLKDLVDRILLLANLENQEQLQDETYELWPVLEPILSSMEILATDRQLKMDYQSIESVDCRLRGDPLLFELAVRNIVLNAIEFSPHGACIELTASVENDFVHIFCKDEGAGIPEYALEKIFDRFYSLQRPDSGQKSTGLGLSLVYAVMQLHGGQVRVAENQAGSCIVQLSFPVSE